MLTTLTTEEIVEMAREAGLSGSVAKMWVQHFEAFAKLVAEKAIAKDREEFDIDELCARQNKIGYKQGYRAGQLAEREACAKVCDELCEHWGDYKDTALLNGDVDLSNAASGEPRAAARLATAIRARGNV
jgi:hypothetical protein